MSTNEIIIINESFQDHFGRGAAQKTSTDDRIIAIKSVSGVKDGTVMADLLTFVGRATRVGDLVDRMANEWNPPKGAPAFYRDPRAYVAWYVQNAVYKGVLAYAI